MLDYNDDFEKFKPIRKKKSSKRTLIKDSNVQVNEPKNEKKFFGQIVATEGKVFLVKHLNSKNEKIYFQCIRAGTVISNYKKSSIITVGDNVAFIKKAHIDSTSQLPTGVITEVLERRTSISRISPSAQIKEDIIACNIDNLLILASIDFPPYNKRLIDRYLVAAELGGVKPAICINKIDLLTDSDYADAISNDLKPYYNLNIDIFMISAENNIGIGKLQKFLKNKTTLFSGSSGVGKSTLVNLLIGGEVQKVNEISEKTFKGKHTTSTSKMFELSNGGYIIDTPGIREFGIIGLDKKELSLYYHDFDNYRELCKFYQCSHIHEPGCGVKYALQKGFIDADRYESYLNIYESMSV